MATLSSNHGWSQCRIGLRKCRVREDAGSSVGRLHPGSATHHLSAVSHRQANWLRVPEGVATAPGTPSGGVEGGRRRKTGEAEAKTEWRRLCGAGHARFQIGCPRARRKKNNPVLLAVDNCVAYTHCRVMTGNLANEARVDRPAVLWVCAAGGEDWRSRGNGSACRQRVRRDSSCHLHGTTGWAGSGQFTTTLITGPTAA